MAAFGRFLEAASLSQACSLNITNVARECSVERKTVEQYFIILEDLLLATRLQVFTKKAKQEMTTHPKFLFFDVGVFRALRPQGPLDVPEEIDGAALETLFFSRGTCLERLYANLAIQSLFGEQERSKRLILFCTGLKDFLHLRLNVQEP